MDEQSQRIAVPAYLRRTLQVFREGQGGAQSYQVKDPAKDKVFRFEPWQFFILEILPGCEDFPKLASIFEDRFGSPITKDRVDDLLSTVAGDGLFGLGASRHPMLAAYARKIEQGVVQFANKEQDAAAAAETGRDVAPAAVKPGPAAGVRSAASAAPADGPLPAGVQDAIGLDETIRRKMWDLFDPRPMLKLLQPLLLPLRFTVYLLPLLVFGAIYILIRYAYLMQPDMEHLLWETTFGEHVLFDWFTINLSVALLTALIAHTYRATVSAISIVLVMNVYPRFVARIGNARQLSRRELLWLHASPLLLRIGVFSVAVFIWYGSREMNGYLATFGLALIFVCSFSLIFAANPLAKGSGYYLLAAFLNEPQLRGKAINAFFNKLRGNAYSRADGNVLATYALASLAFAFLVAVGIMFEVTLWLKVSFGATAMIFTAVLGVVLFRFLIGKLRDMELVYERSVQFKRWRKQKLPEELREDLAKISPPGFKTYVKRALPFSLLILLFLPYSYEPGGQFVILAYMKQVLTTDEPGIVAEVYFDGGEQLKKGVVIARLEFDDLAAQVRKWNAKMVEQQSVIAELETLPRPEAITLAEKELETQLERTEFTKGKAERMAALYKDGAISFEELDKAQREYKVDVREVAQKQANLELVKAGVPPDKIAAAKALLNVYKEERDYYQDKIRRTVIAMPFDGTLVTLQLKQKIGSYISKGETFAVVERTDQVIAEIEVPEPDIGYVVKSATVSVVPLAFFDTTVPGVVSEIGSDVIVKPFGRVVKVDAILDNKDPKLKSGMTGYAKITSKTMPVWKVFSLAIARFFQVEVWSWIP